MQPGSFLSAVMSQRDLRTKPADGHSGYQRSEVRFAAMMPATRGGAEHVALLGIGLRRSASRRRLALMRDRGLPPPRCVRSRAWSTTSTIRAFALLRPIMGQGRAVFGEDFSRHGLTRCRRAGGWRHAPSRRAGSPPPHRPGASGLFADQEGRECPGRAKTRPRSSGAKMPLFPPTIKAVPRDQRRQCFAGRKGWSQKSSSCGY